VSKTHRVPQWSKPNAYVTVQQGATAGATIGVNVRLQDGSLYVPASGASSTGPRTTDYLPEGRSNLYYTGTRVYAKVKTIIQAGDNIALEWDDEAQTVTISATGGYSGVPYFIPAGDTFTVPDNIQALFHLPIDLEDETASIVVDGALVEV
jgi:hypothetical protein